MNPASQTSAAPASLMHDVKLPQPTHTAPASATVKAEVVAAIPVKDQAMAGQRAAPVQNSITDQAPATPGASKELDKILKEVNKHVKSMDGVPKPKFSFGHLKANKLILPVTMAVLVAVILTAASFVAFHETPSKVRTRATANAGL